MTKEETQEELRTMKTLEEAVGERAPGGVATDCYADPPHDSDTPLDGPRYAEPVLREIRADLLDRISANESSQKQFFRWGFRRTFMRGVCLAWREVVKDIERRLKEQHAAAKGPVSKTDPNLKLW